MIIQPAKKLYGNLRLPGDKSISHRAAMLAAMATGETQIKNFASSADCAATLRCLENLGVEIKRDQSTVTIKGVGKTGFAEPTVALDCENSGTTVRLLSGILAGQNFTSELTGDASLQKRPMRRVIEPLEKMGAKIESKNGCLPMTIRGRNPLQASFLTTKIPSAQVKSCVLLAGLNADGRTVFSEHTKTRDHTERMLEWFGVQTLKNKTESSDELTILGNQSLSARDLRVPADVSAAAFFLVAAACLQNSRLTLENVGLNPTRTAILDVLQNCGVQIERVNELEVCNEPIGDLTVYGGEFMPRKQATEKNVLRGAVIANLIDELPILAVFGTQIEGGLEIRDAAELRVKESDRIAATVENLRRMNATVEEFPDGLRVEKSSLRGAKIESFGDHRIAMAFSIAALFARGETEIADADCVKVSFPEFYQVLKDAVQEN